MSSKVLPMLGYQLNRVAVVEQSYEWKPLGEHQTDDERQINFFWDWFLIDGENFCVALGCRVSPSQEYPDQVKVTVLGEFTVMQHQPPPAFESFVYEVAPNILFPYVRELVSSITVRGMSKVYYIPPFDVAEVIANDFRFDQAFGMKQLRDDLETAHTFGVTPPNERSRTAGQKGSKSTKTPQSKRKK